MAADTEEGEAYPEVPFGRLHIAVMGDKQEGKTVLSAMIRESLKKVYGVSVKILDHEGKNKKVPVPLFDSGEDTDLARLNNIWHLDHTKMFEHTKGITLNEYAVPRALMTTPHTVLRALEDKFISTPLESEK